MKHARQAPGRIRPSTEAEEADAIPLFIVFHEKAVAVHNLGRQTINRNLRATES